MLFNATFVNSPTATLLQEGSVFNVTRGGASITLHLPDATQHEVINVRRGDLKLAMAKFDEVIYLLAKFGDLPWMDCPFHDGLYHSWEQFELGSVDVSKQTLSVICTIVDGQALVAGARVFTFSRGMTKFLLDTMKAQRAAPIPPEELARRIERTYAMYSVKQMVANALVRCNGGDF